MKKQKTIITDVMDSNADAHDQKVNEFIASNGLNGNWKPWLTQRVVAKPSGIVCLVTVIEWEGEPPATKV